MKTLEQLQLGEQVRERVYDASGHERQCGKCNAKIVEILKLFTDRLTALREKIENKKTRNYNIIKKDHCESCGVKEGMLCKDGCQAMAERYNNMALDHVLELLDRETGVVK